MQQISVVGFELIVRLNFPSSFNDYLVTLSAAKDFEYRKDNNERHKV